MAMVSCQTVMELLKRSTNGKFVVMYNTSRRPGDTPPPPLPRPICCSRAGDCCAEDAIRAAQGGKELKTNNILHFTQECRDREDNLQSMSHSSQNDAMPIGPLQHKPAGHETSAAEGEELQKRVLQNKAHNKQPENTEETETFRGRLASINTDHPN
ncbi:hypothetical protein NFI96_016152, partial [Prochilodus magdalenae]